MSHRFNVQLKSKLTFSIPNVQSLPPSIDLESAFPPVFDQGQEGSCTGNGWAGVWAFFELLDLKQKCAAPEEFSTTSFVPASRQFIYYCERDHEGTIAQDAGSQISTGAWVLANIGCCDEAIWPYSQDNWETKPSTEAYEEAANHKILNSFALNDFLDIKHCLADGYPVICGIEVFDNIESDEVAQTGILNMPTAEDKLQGGHCVVIVGYDDSTSRFKIRNSWGTTWGMNGYFTVEYCYISQYGSEFMTLRK